MTRPRRPRKPPASSYAAAHAQVRRLRGRAVEHQCIDCGQQAQQWSYNGTDLAEESAFPKERANKPLVWSMNIEAYDPRCHRCHRIHDGRPVSSQLISVVAE